MDLSEAIAQKEKIYGRIKEVRLLLEDCKDGGERLRQTDRLRILRDMYRDACAQVDALRPPQDRKQKAPKHRVVHTDGVGFDFFERCGTVWSDIEGTTWSELGMQAQTATAHQADFLTQALRRSMEALTPMQFEVLMSRYQDGMSLEEIAKQRNVNRSTVCRVAKQALNKLERGVIAAMQVRECVTKDGFDFLGFAETTDVLTDRQREYLYFLLTDGATMGEIARYLRTNTSTVSRGSRRITERLSAVAAGLPERPNASKIKREEWINVPEGEIAAMLGISPSVYYRYICRGQMVQGIPRLAYEILRLKGLPVSEVARQLGLSENTVRAYRKRYQHMDVSSFPEPVPYTPAPRQRAHSDLRSLLSRNRVPGPSIGDSIDARTYQRMMEVASHADP